MLKSVTVFVGGALAVVIATTVSGLGPLPDSPDAEIDRTLAEWADAFQRGDIAALVALVSEDAEFWTNGAPPVVGRKQLKRAFEDFFAQFSAVQRFEEVERTVIGDFAFLRGEEVNTLTPNGGGDAFEYRQRAFSILRRGDDGRWRFWRGMTNQGPMAGESAG